MLARKATMVDLVSNLAGISGRMKALTLKQHCGHA
jgi:hypothetical protein